MNSIVFLNVEGMWSVNQFNLLDDILSNWATYVYKRIRRFEINYPNFFFTFADNHILKKSLKETPNDPSMHCDIDCLSSTG